MPRSRSREEDPKALLNDVVSVDLVGSIPWEIIALFGEAAGFKATEGQAVQIIRTLKVPKLLRLGRPLNSSHASRAQRISGAL